MACSVGARPTASKAATALLRMSATRVSSASGSWRGGIEIEIVHGVEIPVGTKELLIVTKLGGNSQSQKLNVGRVARPHRLLKFAGRRQDW